MGLRPTGVVPVTVLDGARLTLPVGGRVAPSLRPAGQPVAYSGVAPATHRAHFGDGDTTTPYIPYPESGVRGRNNVESPDVPPATRGILAYPSRVAVGP